MIDKGLYRQNFYRGSMSSARENYRGNTSASTKPSAPPGGGATSLGSRRDYSPSRGSDRGPRDDPDRGGPSQSPSPSPSYTDRVMDVATNRLPTYKFTDIVEASDQYGDPFERFRNKPMGDIPFTGLASMAANIFRPILEKARVVNRNFFLDKVLPAGRFTNMNFSNLSTSQQEQLYKEYLDQRLSNNIDAYGNPLMQGGGEGIASIPRYIIPETEPQFGVEPEPEMSFYETLRKNLGLI